MDALADRVCVPCRRGGSPLSSRQAGELAAELSPDWTVVDGHHLVRRLHFPDFASALAFTNRIGQIAEDLDHHPDLMLGWGRVEITIWTHVIDGLSENDFIFAARVDRLLTQDKSGSKGTKE